MSSAAGGGAGRRRGEERGSARRQVPFSEVWALIREDYEACRRDATKPGFKALLVHRLNAWRLTVRRRSLRAPLGLVLDPAFRWMRNHYGIELPPTASIGRRFRITHPGGIVVHRYAVIGDDCELLHGVTLGAPTDVTPETAPRLGNGVRVGAGAKILGPVTIGDGARIGPNAVILADVPAGATAFAPPARIIYPA